MSRTSSVKVILTFNSFADSMVAIPPEKIFCFDTQEAFMLEYKTLS